jgi:hypothetical protein
LRWVTALRRPSWLSGGPLSFLHRANEAEAFARQCFDQALLAAVVTDGGPSGIQAGRQRSIRDDASIPYRANEIVLADDAVSVSN